MPNLIIAERQRLREKLESQKPSPLPSLAPQAKSGYAQAPATPLAPSPSLSGAVWEASGPYPKIVGAIPPIERVTKYSTEAEKQLAMKRTIEYGLSLAVPVAFMVAPQTAFVGAVVGTGISEGASLIFTGKPLTLEETFFAAGSGAVFNVAGTGVFQVTGVGALSGVKGVVARAGVSAGLVGGAGYIVSGGKPEAAMYGAALGAGFSLTGEAVSRAAPYVRQGLSRLSEKLFPERAMYNRVVSQEESAPLMDRILGKVSPERLMYKHVTSAKAPANIFEAKDISTTYRTPSGFAKQSLFVKAQTQTQAMKPFLPTLQLSKQAPVVALALTMRATPKTATKQETKTATVTQMVMQREMASTIQQQVVNPFIAFQGKPFYRQRSREELDYLYMTYPLKSPLETPETRITQTQLQRSLPLQRQTPMFEQTPLEKEMLGQGQAIIQEQKQSQIQKQIQEQVQALTQKQKTVQRNWNLGDFDMPPGFNRIDNLIFGKYGRYKRHYPIMTGKQWLKEMMK